MNKNIKIKALFRNVPLPFGVMCLEVYEKAYNSGAIENFILDVLTKGNDMKLKSRTKFVHQYFNDESSSKPSDFILHYLRSQLIGNDV